MRFTVYQESRQGGRANNEDRVAYCYSRDALLMVVADGMGGHFHGEIAAQFAVQTLTDNFQREAAPSLADPFLFLQKSFFNAHHAILDYSARHRLDDSPRTTCVACVIQDNIAYWAHAGDSRLYLLRDGKVLARTRDHSRVRLLLDEGLITEAQAAVHPDRNRIYSCLGSNHPPEIEFSRKTPLTRNDVLILCSDGLWGQLTGDALAGALRFASLMEAVPALLTQAEERAGKRSDNLTAVAVRWEENYVEETSSIISTQAMAMHEINTRLEEFGRSASYKTDLSEDEIEKAIEEIRSAIDKYNPRK